MSDNRTHEPTAKKRQRAIADGRVVASSQVVGSGLWIVTALVLCVAGGGIVNVVTHEFVRFWETPWVNAHADVDVQTVMLRPFALVVPVLALLLIVAIALRVAQVGFLWVPSRIAPDVGRLNASKRVTQIASGEAGFQFVRGLGLVVCAVLFIGLSVWQQHEQLSTLAISNDFSDQIVQLFSNWGLKLGVCLMAFAAFDYAYQRYRFEQSLHMSPDEVREEVKAVAGNAQVTAERKNLQQQLSWSRSAVE